MTAVLGVDFTSAPRPRKPITVARGRLVAGALALEAIDPIYDWPAFEGLLAERGPWIGGFDFPFGLPREAVIDLGWPGDWPALVAHCAALGRTELRAAFDAYRASRPAGRKYPHRATDLPAGSHSPIKLVNPPVALMFLEGAPRLARAGVTIPGLAAGDPQRVAVEAYPGLAARAITRASYKSDESRKQTAERRRVRARDRFPAGTRRRVLRLPARRDAHPAALASGRRDRRPPRRGARRDAGRVVSEAPRAELGSAARDRSARGLDRERDGMIAGMDLDALRLALLAACSDEQALVHRIHGELEHWLNRPLATEDIEAALAELEAHGFVAAARETTTVAYVTTETGRVLVAERWEEFFPE